MTDELDRALEREKVARDALRSIFERSILLGVTGDTQIAFAAMCAIGRLEYPDDHKRDGER